MLHFIFLLIDIFFVFGNFCDDFIVLGQILFFYFLARCLKEFVFNGGRWFANLEKLVSD